MKLSKKKIIIFSIIALIIISPYIYFKSFDEYTLTSGPRVTSKDAVVYNLNNELSYDGKVHYDKKIGRIKGVGFFETVFSGPWVYSDRYYDKKEAIVLQYLMENDYVYTKK